MFPFDRAMKGVSLYLALTLLLLQRTLTFGSIVLDFFFATVHFMLHPLSREQNMNLLLKVIARPTPPPVAPYVPEDEPPPTIFEIKLHPEWKKVCDQLDDYFVKNWPAFNTKKAKDAFVASETNKWSCWAMPHVRSDRLYDSVRVTTLLFLLDGEFIHLPFKYTAF